jgi:hypothetical protein
MSRHLAWIYRSFGTVAKIRTACCGKLPVSHCVDKSYVLRHPPTLLRSQADTQTIGLHHLRGSKWTVQGTPRGSCHIADNSAVLNLVCSPILDIRKRLRHDHLTSGKSILNCVSEPRPLLSTFNRRVSSGVLRLSGNLHS